MSANRWQVREDQMSKFTAADGKLHNTVTASSVSRFLASKGFEKASERFGYGFNVYEVDGVVTADNFSNPSFESAFFTELSKAGYQFSIEADVTHQYAGTPLRVLAARITSRKVGA